MALNYYLIYIYSSNSYITMDKAAIPAVSVLRMVFPRVAQQAPASMMASAVSAKPVVREFLLGMQRRLAEKNNVVMDGRDIGTVILPDAQVKIFLTADVNVRAERRYKELIEKGQEVDFNEVLEDMKIRDYNDSHRPIAPLKQADDAVLADTTNLSFDESLELLLKITKEGISA